MQPKSQKPKEPRSLDFLDCWIWTTDSSGLLYFGQKWVNI